MEVSFTLPGRIRGKGRPRFARVGKFVRTYTDEKTESAEAMVRTIAAQAMGGRPPIYGPVSLAVVEVQNPPASWSKRKQARTKWVTGKPDIDNVTKLIGDSLNRIVFHDDSQVCCLSYLRRYALDEAERVEIVVHELVSEEPSTERLEMAPLFAGAAA